MKIKELWEVTGKGQYGDNYKFSKYGHAKEQNIIRKYEDKDCIVAYKKETLGMIFIIKSAKKYFAFASLINGEPYFGGHGYKLCDISIKKALELMGNEIIIIDKELFGNLNKYMILEAL